VLSLADSSITTSVANGAGNGGDINIDPVFVVLNNSQIIARAVGGNGGDITIVTQFLISDEASVIDASSRFGLSGQVVVTAPEVDVSSRLATLSSAYVDPASRLRESCATRAGAGNSFVGVGRGGLPSSPQSAAFAAYGGFAPLAVALPAGGARSCPS
jgi:large exoprotein involved in heme utilization and adhesion